MYARIYPLCFHVHACVLACERACVRVCVRAGGRGGGCAGEREGGRLYVYRLYFVELLTLNYFIHKLF